MPKNLLKWVGIIIGIFFLVKGLALLIEPKIVIDIKPEYKKIGSNMEEPIEVKENEDSQKSQDNSSAQQIINQDVKEEIKKASIQIGDIEYFLQDVPQITPLQGSITNVEIIVSNEGNVPLVLEIKSKLLRNSQELCYGTDKFIYEPSQKESLDYSALEAGKIIRTNHQRFSYCSITEKGEYEYYAELIESTSGVVLDKKSKTFNVK